MVFKKLPITAILIVGLLAVIYFFTRLTNIMSLPLFTDEAIYVRWAQIARFDAAWRFISLTDGKQPSFVWLAMNSMRIFDDPLFASRIVSVATGFGTLLGLMFVAWEIFKKRLTNGSILSQMFGHLKNPDMVGYIVGLLFVFYPFALVYDRMALYDSTLACAMVWTLYMTVMLVRYVRLDLGLLFGFAVGSAMLTKTSGFFGLYLLPVSLLLFNWKQKHKWKKVTELGAYMLCGVIVAFIMYTVLRLSPFFYIIDEKNGLFVWTFSQWLQANKIEIFISNFNGLFGWLVTYVSFPVLILAVGSLFIKNQRAEKLFLLLWFLIPFAGLMVMGKTIYPRFIYFMTPPLLLLAASTLTYLYQAVRPRIYFFIALIIVLFIYIRADYFIIYNISYAPIPQSDLGQYINSWPAGGGVKEMISFFKKEAATKGKIYVATQGTFGSLPTYAMEIYLGGNPNIETRGIYPLPDLIPEDLKEKAQTIPVYVVLNDTEEPPSSWPVTEVAKYKKGIGDRNLSIFKVNP